jgi:hypothetical protein
MACGYLCDVIDRSDDDPGEGQTTYTLRHRYILGAVTWDEDGVPSVAADFIVFERQHGPGVNDTAPDWVYTRLVGTGLPDSFNEDFGDGRACQFKWAWDALPDGSAWCVYGVFPPGTPGSDYDGVFIKVESFTSEEIGNNARSFAVADGEEGPAVAIIDPDPVDPPGHRLRIIDETGVILTLTDFLGNETEIVGASDRFFYIRKMIITSLEDAESWATVELPTITWSGSPTDWMVSLDGTIRIPCFGTTATAPSSYVRRWSLENNISSFPAGSFVAHAFNAAALDTSVPFPTGSGVMLPHDCLKLSTLPRSPALANVEFVEPE